MIKNLSQIQTEETRRALLNVLAEAPAAIRAKTVRNVMDMMNAPTSWADFVCQVEYLAGEELIRVFPFGAGEELSAVEQAKLIATMHRMSPESAEADRIMLRIRQRGRHFVEGNVRDVLGVAQ